MYTSFGGSAKLQQTITGDEFLGYGFEDLHFFLLFWSGFLNVICLLLLPAPKGYSRWHSTWTVFYRWQRQYFENGQPISKAS
jgi:hypothetical protein